MPEPYQLIPSKKLTKLAKASGIDFGHGDPNNRLRYWTKIGLIPHAVRKKVGKKAYTEGHYPYYTLNLLKKIQTYKEIGLNDEEIKRHLQKEQVKYVASKAGIEIEKIPPVLDPHQLIPTQVLIAIGKASGIDFGHGNPNNRLRYWTKIGLIPHAVRKKVGKKAYTEGHYPYYVLDLLKKIQLYKKIRLDHKEIKRRLEKEHAKYVVKKAGMEVKRKLKKPSLSALSRRNNFTLAVACLTLLILTALAILGIPTGIEITKDIKEIKKSLEKNLALIKQQLSARPPEEKPTLAHILSPLPENLIINSSFESYIGPTSENKFGQAWRWGYSQMGHNGNVYVTNESIRTGSLGLKFFEPAASLATSANLGITQSETTIINGRSYILSVFIRTKEITGKPKLRLGFYGTVSSADPNYQGSGWSEYSKDKYQDFNLRNLRDWTQFSFTYENAALGKYPVIEILGYQGGIIYLDDVTLSEATRTPFIASPAADSTIPIQSIIFHRENLALGEGSIKVDPNGNLYPADSSRGSLGLEGSRFSRLYVSEADIATNLTVSRIASDLLPSKDETYDLGSSTNEWKDLYVDGTANIDSLEVETITAGIWQGTAITTTYGGTGLSSYTAGDLLYYSSGTALSKLGIESANYVLTSSGTAPQWVAQSTLSVGDADTLDSLDSTQFLRSDTSDSFTSGTLTTAAGTILNIAGTWQIGGTGVGATAAEINLLSGESDVGVSILTDANIPDDLTISASGTVADGALSGNVSLLGQTIESSEITDDTITTSDLAATLTFAAGDLVDLSAAINQGKGLKLPQGTATPTAPASGEGLIFWDIDNDKLYVYNASSWQQVGLTEAQVEGYIFDADNTGTLSSGTLALDSLSYTGTLDTTYGGTGLASYTAGDLLYYSSGTALSKLGIGSANYILTSTSSAPQWVSELTDAQISNALTIDNSSTGYIVLEQGTAPGDTTEGRIQWDTDDDRLVVGDSTGTKTFYSDLGAGLTAGKDIDIIAGAIDIEATLDYVSTINLAGEGTLNALDAIDATTETTIENAIDTLGNLTSASSLATVGTITAGTWNADVIITTHGGTGLASYTAGDLLYYSSGTALSKLGIGSANYILTSTSSAPQWVSELTDTQISNTLTISGGTIDNSVIGGTTPAAGTFTDLTANDFLTVSRAATISAQIASDTPLTIKDETAATVATIDSDGNLDVAGTLTSGTADAFQVSTGGAITAASLDAGSGTIQTIGQISGDTGVFSTSVTSPSFTGSGAVTLSSGGSSDLTLDSAANLVLADSNVKLSAGDVTIDPYSAAADTTVTLANSGGSYVANLSIEGQLRIGNFASAPTAIGAGALYYNTTDNKIYYYNGSEWKEVGSGGTITEMTNNSGSNLSQYDLVIIDTSANDSFTTTTTAYSKKVLGVLQEDCNNGVSCDVQVAGATTLNCAQSASRGEYVYTSSTAGQCSTSAKQHDGLIGIVTTEDTSSPYAPEVVIVAQPEASAINNVDRYIKHNDYRRLAEAYSSGTETYYVENTAKNKGVYFDTFGDSIKMDSANTDIQLDDNKARSGLWGGQTYNSTNTDPEGNNYLGASDANDVYYYDTSADSSASVQVDLGIDPNWRNGVTLIDETNLSTSYNGSLIKASGTYNTEDGSITLTITSVSNTSVTFNWDTSGATYSGDEDDTANFGEATSLVDDSGDSDTGIDVTFTKANYHIGDRFRIASWFIEPATANDRGPKQEFPERSYIVASDVAATSSYVDIIDADENKLWMHFTMGPEEAQNMIAGWQTGGADHGHVTSIHALNGKLYAATSLSSSTSIKSGLNIVNFASDTGTHYGDTKGSYDGVYPSPISGRNDESVYDGTGATLAIVAGEANDVHAAVINKNAKKLQARAYLSANQEDIAHGTWTKVQLNAERYDVAGNFDSSTNYRFTAPETGYYQVNTAISWVGASVVADKDYIYAIYKNGSVVTEGYTHASYVSYVSSVGSDTIYLAKDDYIELYAYHTAGVDTVDIHGHEDYTYLSIYLIDETETAYKTYVAVATDGGVSVINETDETVVDEAPHSGYTVSDIYLTSKGEMYFNHIYTSGDDDDNLYVFYNVQGRTADWPGTPNSDADAIYVGNIPALNTPQNTPALNDIYVTEGTSIIDGSSNTVYLAYDVGLTVLQEKQGDESDGSVKYYTKDYITEEMVGDIRDMNPMNGSGELAADTTISGFDASVKANAFTTAGSGTTPNYVSGVRGTALEFDGGDYVCTGTTGTCADDDDLDFSTLTTMGAWIKTSASETEEIIRKLQAGVEDKSIGVSSGGVVTYNLHSAVTGFSGNQAVNDGQWHFVVGTYNGSIANIYVDGQLDNSKSASGDVADGTGSLCIGQSGADSNFFTGTIDEPFITAEALSAEQIAHMYEVGKRALEGGGDSESELAGSTDVTKAVAVDYNNQFAYVGTNDGADGGAVSKIDLNSDVVPTSYTTATDPPILDNDVTTLSVGYDLEIVGNDGVGAMNIGLDANGNDTSGTYYSKTQTLDESITQAYIWLSEYVDSSDSGSSITVYACNEYSTKDSCDSNSTWNQATLLNTDSNQDPTEKTYYLGFSNPGSYLTIKLVMARTDTKSNIYLTQYGIGYASEEQIGGAGGNGLFSNNSDSLADGSYVQVAHNQDTNDILANAWLYDESIWKLLSSDYTPAIAFEGKNLLHNDYLTTAKTNNLIGKGLFFDTFADGTKIDGGNSTVALDDEKALAGLWGGDDYTETAGDDDSEANQLLSDNDVNDVYYYDRTQYDPGSNPGGDSSGVVQVELGIDPNWYNGVTLVTQCQEDCAGKTNLSTTYNGSLVKVHGVRTDDKGMFVKVTATSPTQATYSYRDSDTETWSSGGSINYDTPTEMGSTGIYVEFTQAEYQIGDEFRIASWYIEAPATDVRGSKQQFPEHAYLIAQDNYLSIIDADTNKLWMRFDEGGSSWPSDTNMIGESAATGRSVFALNGVVYVGHQASWGLVDINFITDSSIIHTDVYRTYNSNIGNRNAGSGYTASLGTSLGIVNATINDVHAAVINKNAKKLQARAYLSANQEDITSGTATKVQLNAETFDVGGNFDSSTNYRFTAPETGYYQINGTIGWYSTSVVADKVYSCLIYKNGSNIMTEYAHASHANSVSSVCSDTVYLAKDDYIELYGWHDAGVDTVDIQGSSPLTFLSIYLIDETDTAYKTYVAVATDGGVSVINETDESVVDFTHSSWPSTGIDLTTSGDMYFIFGGLSDMQDTVNVFYDTQSITTDQEGWTDASKIYYYQSTPALHATQQHNKDVFVTEGTSTIDGTSNTIYVGHNAGLTVIQEKQGDESDGSVKYYTKDYITEEMVGDIRGMWSMNGTADANIPNSSTITDVSVKTNNGTTSDGTDGSMYYRSGVRGTGIEFDGSDDYINCGHDSSLDITDAITIGAWIKPDSLSGGIVWKGGGDNASTNPYRLWITGSAAEIWVSDGSSWYGDDINTPTLSTGKWYHVVGTYGDPYIRIYLNGQLAGEKNIGSISILSDSGKDVGIGAEIYATVTQHFNGIIDEVFITDEALTAEQIAHMYEVGKRALLDGSDTVNELAGSVDVVKAIGVTQSPSNSVTQNNYAYVGTAGTDTGAISRIDLNSDVISESYTTATTPAILDNDVTSLSVGTSLEIACMDGVGCTAIPYDSNGDGTSNKYYYSETITLDKDIASAVLWLSAYDDFADSTSAITVSASSDGGSNYDTCTKITSGSEVKSDTENNSENSTSSTIYTATEGTITTNDEFNNWYLRFTSGTLKGQHRLITDTVEGTDNLVVEAFGSAPGDGDSFEILPRLADVYESEYSCNFTTSGRKLKVKIEFDRSANANIFASQYGITWLGATGFKIEQSDSNTVRLYNYTGETVNARLDIVTGGLGQNAGTLSLAPEAADVDSKDSTNSIWVNKTGSGGNLIKLALSGTDRFVVDSGGGLTLTSADTTGTAASIVADSVTTGTGLDISVDALTSGKGLDLTSTSTGMTGSLASLTLSGSNAANTGSVLEITNSGTLNTGTSLYVKHYATGTNNLAFRVDDVASDTTPFVIDGTGNVGIGTTGPGTKLDVNGNIAAGGYVDIGGFTERRVEVIGGDVHIWDSSDLGSDLVTNGDNEGAVATFDPEDYTTHGTYAQSSEQAHGGSNSAKLTRTTAGNGNIYHVFRDSNNSSVTVGKLYKCSIWVYLPSGQTLSTIQIKHGAGVLGQTTVTDTWVQFTYYKVAAASWYFYPLGLDADQNEYFYIDDISIEEVIGGDLIARGLLTGGGTSGLKIDQNGNVGIGTTGPATRLDVKSSGVQTNPFRVSASAGSGVIQIWENTSNELAFQIKDSSGNTDVYIRPDGKSYFNGGNVGIGTTSPNDTLEVKGANAAITIYDTSDSPYLNFKDSAGSMRGNFHLGDSGDGENEDSMYYYYDNNENVYFYSTTTNTHILLSDGTAQKSSGAGDWAAISDERLKKDTKPIENAVEKLTKLKGVSFRWINPADHNNITTTRMGFMAQEMEQVYPEWVHAVDPGKLDKTLIPENDTAKGYSLPGDFKALVVEAIREQQGQIEGLGMRIDEVGNLAAPETSEVSEDLTSEVEDTSEEELLLTELEARLTDLEEKYATLSAQLTDLEAIALSPASEATLSAELAETELTLDSLVVSGKTILADLGVTGDITAGLLVIDGLEGSIQTLSGPLKLQELALGSLEIMGGKVVVDSSGNLTVKGTITAKKVITNELEVGKIRVATESAGLVDEEATIGTATIPAGETLIVVKNNQITENSLIFVTPKTTISQPLAVTKQIEGESFAVEVEGPVAEEVKFNWWIIN